MKTTTKNIALKLGAVKTQTSKIVFGIKADLIENCTSNQWSTKLESLRDMVRGKIESEKPILRMIPSITTITYAENESVNVDSKLLTAGGVREISNMADFYSAIDYCIKTLVEGGYILEHTIRTMSVVDQYDKTPADRMVSEALTILLSSKSAKYSIETHTILSGSKSAKYSTEGNLCVPLGIVDLRDYDPVESWSTLDPEDRSVCPFSGITPEMGSVVKQLRSNRLKTFVKLEPGDRFQYLKMQGKIYRCKVSHEKSNLMVLRALDDHKVTVQYGLDEYKDGMAMAVPYLTAGVPEYIWR